MTKPFFSEREMMEDSLNTQKQISSAYNQLAGECSDPQLRTVFLNILNEEQNIGAEIFEEMSARGWQQTKKADNASIQKAKDKYLNQ